MKKRGIHEDWIQQMYRLFVEKLYAGDEVAVDEQNRIRMDDLEMRADVQQAIKENWEKLNSENIEQLADLEGYRRDFLRLFGFGLEDVDYEQEVEVDVPIL